MQYHHILIENGIAWGKPEVHYLLLMLHALALLKAVLSFNT